MGMKFIIEVTFIDMTSGKRTRIGQLNVIS